VNIRTALGADYSMLIVPGGIRSIEKLRLTAHTKRVIASFIQSGKPVAVFDEAFELLANAADLAARKVSGPAANEEAARQTGAEWDASGLAIDNNLLTATTVEKRDEAIAQVMKLFTAQARAIAPASQAA
jgi:protease I